MRVFRRPQKSPRPKPGASAGSFGTVLARKTACDLSYSRIAPIEMPPPEGGGIVIWWFQIDARVPSWAPVACPGRHSKPYFSRLESLPLPNLSLILSTLCPQEISSGTNSAVVNKSFFLVPTQCAGSLWFARSRRLAEHLTTGCQNAACIGSLGSTGQGGARSEDPSFLHLVPLFCCVGSLVPSSRPSSCRQRPGSPVLPHER